MAAYFNSHAHVERDETVNPLELLRFISTHTLTWSVTRRYMIFNSFSSISTHTLTWSVTPTCLYSESFARISTHTLTWSVTLRPSPYRIGYHYFNSHAHVERDLLHLSFISLLLNFNSHAHVERDAAAIFRLISSSVFQLTRSRGA